MKRALLATLVAATFAAGAPAVIAQTAKPGTEGPAVQRQAPRQHTFRMPSERGAAKISDKTARCVSLGLAITTQSTRPLAIRSR